jgi:hypothetical protein
MDNDDIEVQITIPKTATNVHWMPSSRLKIGGFVQKKDLLGVYAIKKDSQPSIKITAPITGKISWVSKPNKMDFASDEEVPSQRPTSLMICRIEPCKHKIVYSGTCTDCFEPCQSHEAFKISEKIQDVTTDSSYVNESIESILKQKKLVLLLDIDNTILHALKASNEQIDQFVTRQKEGEKEFFTLELDALNAFIVKIRPFLSEFLEQTSKIFEIIVYTFGTRSYATAILGKIDPDERYLKVNL